MSNSAILNSGKSEIVGKKYYIRYMLSLRCKNTVIAELKNLEVRYIRSFYGALEFPDGIEQKKIKILKRNLRKSGLDLLNLHESMLVDKIINTITEVIHDFDDLPGLTYSEIISKNLNEASESVMKIFTEVVGMSVVQFIVLQKIDRIKEHLLYDSYSILEISKKLNYKSDQHLVAQFKKYTGLTPAHFKKLKKVRDKNKLEIMREAKEKKSIRNKSVG